MAKYKISFDATTEVLTVGFGDEQAETDQVFLEALGLAEDIKESLHGTFLKINGSTALPIAMMFAHKFGHLVKAIAVYVPATKKYLVAISHNPDYVVGSWVK